MCGGWFESRTLILLVSTCSWNKERHQKYRIFAVRFSRSFFPSHGFCCSKFHELCILNNHRINNTTKVELSLYGSNQKLLLSTNWCTPENSIVDRIFDLILDDVHKDEVACSILTQCPSGVRNSRSHFSRVDPLLSQTCPFPRYVTLNPG